MSLSRVPRTLTTVAVVASCLTAAGCSSTGTETQCSTSACTVTFDRGVDAKTSILGVEAELVGVEGDQVRLKVAGQTVSVPVGGDATADGFAVSVQDVTNDNVVVKISRGGN